MRKRNGEIDRAFESWEFDTVSCALAKRKNKMLVYIATTTTIYTIRHPLKRTIKWHISNACCSLETISTHKLYPNRHKCLHALVVIVVVVAISLYIEHTDVLRVIDISHIAFVCVFSARFCCSFQDMFINVWHFERKYIHIILVFDRIFKNNEYKSLTTWPAQRNNHTNNTKRNLHTIEPFSKYCITM